MFWLTVPEGARRQLVVYFLCTLEQKHVYKGSSSGRYSMLKSFHLKLYSLTNNIKK